MSMRDALIAELSQFTFGRNIRGAVRGLWIGVYSAGEFFRQMVYALERGIFQAFKEGFAEFGISMDEMNTEDKGAMFNFLANQAVYIDGFAQSIIQNNKNHGGKMGPHMLRAEMWINRYKEARSLARVIAAKDRHLVWVLGNSEHCGSCTKLAGKVKRGSVWLEHDIRPQHPALECGGYKCKCDLIPTNEPASRGPLPRIP